MLKIHGLVGFSSFNIHICTHTQKKNLSGHKIMKKGSPKKHQYLYLVE